MENRETAPLSPTPSKWRHALKNKKFIILVVCLACCIVAVTVVSMDKAVAILVDGQTQQVYTQATKVADVLQENDIVIYEGDLVEPEMSAKVKSNDTIKITRAFDFSVFADGKKIVLHSIPLTVQEALEMAGVAVGELDQVSLPLDEIVDSPKKIIVARVDVEYVTREVPVAAPVEIKRDDSLSQGKTKVLQQGSDGLKKEILAIYSKDGQELTRKVTQSTVIKEAQTKVVAQGSMQVASRATSNNVAQATSNTSTASTTKSTPQATTKTSTTTTNKATSGQFVGKEVKTVKAYAYTGDNKTAMGTNTHVGVIAVDPRVISLGTRVYVEGYGYATAEDTGGNIKGNTIDLFMNKESECRTWGVKYVKIYILD